MGYMDLIREYKLLFLIDSGKTKRERNKLTKFYFSICLLSKNLIFIQFEMS